jgi:hypothetical protein
MTRTSKKVAMIQKVFTTENRQAKKQLTPNPVLSAASSKFLQRVTSGEEDSDSGENDDIVEQPSSGIADARVQNEEEEEEEEVVVGDEEGNDEEDENKKDKDKNKNWEFVGNAGDPKDTNFYRVSNFSSMKTGIKNAITNPGDFARNIFREEHG